MESLRIGKYKHYKGYLYELICVGRNKDTLEEYVVYKGLYDSKEFGKNPIWIRAVKDFMGTVVVDGKEVPRFEFIGDEDDTVDRKV